MIAEHRSILQTRVQNWKEVCALYMPGLPQALQDLELHNPMVLELPQIQVEDETLWLPSSLPSIQREAACLPGLALMEEKLHTAQCEDALEGICHILRLKSQMILFKNKNIWGQTYSTRSRSSARTEPH